MEKQKTLFKRLADSLLWNPDSVIKKWKYFWAIALVFIIISKTCTFHPPKPQTEAEKVQQSKNDSFNESQERKRNAAEDAEKQYFSAWDGSCAPLVKYIKDHMNDPESFEHIETKYKIRDGYFFVIMRYTGKNGFGGRVRDNVNANVSFKGEVIQAWK